MVMSNVFNLPEKYVHAHTFFLKNGLYAEEFEFIYSS